ncbi:hypothetical protein OHA91_39470 (plasmid) [Streptomyces erythrochromogenes]|uniref:Phosphatidate cytidylyltransferase n=1 Tax=Streptomyces erythrochromogenes TaxID=285574 RepID=A0ABZ1QRH6_9ACTN|nr:hypothetical protein [Streptomyces erythrochromogenes]
MTPTPDRRMRLRITILTLGAIAMIVAGAAAEWWWLLGIGVWTMIVAFVTELIYRP